MRADQPVTSAASLMVRASTRATQSSATLTHLCQGWRLRPTGEPGAHADDQDDGAVRPLATGKSTVRPGPAVRREPRGARADRAGAAPARGPAPAAQDGIGERRRPRTRVV